MKYVLDTNAVSALMKGDARVLERLKLERRGDVGVPQPVLAEIAYGIERLPRSKRKENLRARVILMGANPSLHASAWLMRPSFRQPARHRGCGREPVGA